MRLYNLQSNVPFLPADLCRIFFVGESLLFSEQTIEFNNTYFLQVHFPSQEEHNHAGNIVPVSLAVCQHHSQSPGAGPIRLHLS